MTFDEIKTRPGTYTTDNGETMAVVFVGEEIFGVSATRYSGIHLFTLDAAECRNDVWVESPDKIKVTFDHVKAGAL